MLATPVVIGEETSSFVIVVIFQSMICLEPANKKGIKQFMVKD